jgi:5-carboxymethyl-2-hydroxymuconate isomerase
MPHFHIEYSGNLENIVDISALCEEIRIAASRIPTFPMPGIRIRATRVDHYTIADGNPKHGFVDLSIRIREGRAEEVKSDAVERVFEALKSFMAPAMESHSIALSAELRDIDANLSPKFGNIRDHLEKST